jgi:hypothetical protein
MEINPIGLETRNMLMNLKLNAIYLLPDGDELVARRGTCGECSLHDPSEGATAPPVYIMSRSGQLLSWNRRSTWTAMDLEETDRASLPEIERLILL